MASDGCTLCDLPTPEPPVTAPEVDGRFCCRGCLSVHRALDDAPDERAAVRERLAGEDPGSDGSPEAGTDSCFLHVDGMHCSTCEAFLERRAEGLDGVARAEASYASDMMRVVYDPDGADPDGIAAAVTGSGYRASVREALADRAPTADSTVAFLIGGGLFGMMVMCWYVLFLYPAYLGWTTPFVDLAGPDGLYLHLNVWVLTTVVLGYTGYPLFRGAVVALRARRPNMDLLVSLAAGSAYAYSTVALLVGAPHLYFDVSVAIVLTVTLGNYYEDHIRRRASGLLADLAGMRVEAATRYRDGHTERVPVDALGAGERVLVRPGERVPVDGTVVEGTAAVDEALVTGEAVPVTRGPGAPVVGGSVVTDAPLVVETGPDATSTLDRLVERLWAIQSATPGVQRLADRIATVFVPLVLVLALLAAGWQLVTGASLDAALLTGLTVLVVSCPCALGLATPLAVASGVRALADRGAVVTSTAVFEAAPDVDVVVLDKTGTLTTAEMRVERVVLAGDASDRERDRLLARAGAVEAFSTHPIATAIAAAVEDPPSATAVEPRPRGVLGTVDGDRVVVGHPELLAREGCSVPGELRRAVEDARAEGQLPVLVGWGGRARGLVVVGDTPRPGWEATLSRLGTGRELVVLTGDDERATARFRGHDAVSEVFAGVPPEAKARTVMRLQRCGVVAMVGDGSNDAPALAAADVGIAMGGGTALASDAADAVVTTDDLATVATVLETTRRTHRRVRENLAWAFCYNGVAVPLAVAGLLNPLFAAVAMASSSLLVVANSSRSVAPAETVTDPSASADAPSTAGRTPARSPDGAPGNEAAD